MSQRIPKKKLHSPEELIPATVQQTCLFLVNTYQRSVDLKPQNNQRKKKNHANKKDGSY